MEHLTNDYFERKKTELEEQIQVFEGFQDQLLDDQLADHYIWVSNLIDRLKSKAALTN